MSRGRKKKMTLGAIYLFFKKKLDNKQQEKQNFLQSEPLCRPLPVYITN